MTAKEFVKSKIPKARAEKHLQGRIKGLQKANWLIRDNGQTMYFASGKTESKAWVAAKTRIIEIDTKPRV